MAKYYKTTEFKQLRAEWMDRLAQEGFEDHETHQGSLKTHDRRTLLWDSRDEILEHFLRVESFITNHAEEIEPKYRIVLELYVQGRQIREISKQSGFCRNWVTKIIARYQKLVR